MERKYTRILQKTKWKLNSYELSEIRLGESSLRLNVLTQTNDKLSKFALYLNFKITHGVKRKL